MNQQFSVIIIVKNRMQQLRNVLESMTHSSIKPTDIQIVAMDNEDYNLGEEYSLTILHHTVDGDALFLAKARNVGASYAKTDTLIFLDVDCIVHPKLFEMLIANLNATTVLTAYPRYLPFLPEHGIYSKLEQESIPHPSRKDISSMVPVKYSQFWSLVFAINKSTFDTIGGFDEKFIGYGGEDTDFARSFDAQGITLLFIDSFVLHQYHVKYDPPLNYLESIVLNATIYKEKWGDYPMYSWLLRFQDMGLLAIDNSGLHILRNPTEHEIQSTVSDNPY